MYPWLTAGFYFFSFFFLLSSVLTDVVGSSACVLLLLAASPAFSVPPFVALPCLVLAYLWPQEAKDCGWPRCSPQPQREPAGSLTLPCDLLPSHCQPLLDTSGWLLKHLAPYAIRLWNHLLIDHLAFIPLLAPLHTFLMRNIFMCNFLFSYYFLVMRS